MSRHWTNDDLINRLYEISTGDEAHLAGCADCGQRWEQLLARRQEVLAEPPVPVELLANQRRQIYRRIESGRPRFWHLRWAPALAALSMVALGVMLSGPAPAPKQTPVAAAEDSQFFTEMYAMVSTEPEVVTPIRGLFEE